MPAIMRNLFDFIAIEGVIGAGKTTLAQLIAERSGARPVLEQFEENPFLPKFYQDRKRYAFQTQLAFLASRFKQQEKMTSRDLFDRFIISDYIFEKDRIFARLNLDDDEMSLYDTIYSIMTGISAKPDLVIYLQSTVERLMENIVNRGRDYERHITPDYLKELSDAYNQFFYHYNKAPLIIINASNIDFVNNPEHLAYIEEQIFEQPIRSNTHIHIIPDS
jgi:deoxyguanosine kinase